MQQSLKLLVNVADYEDRKLQLEGLKNRLEAIASPSIVQAFSSCNTGKFDLNYSLCLFYFVLFQSNLYYMLEYSPPLAEYHSS